MYPIAGCLRVEPSGWSFTKATRSTTWKQSPADAFVWISNFHIAEHFALCRPAHIDSRGLSVSLTPGGLTILETSTPKSFRVARDPPFSRSDMSGHLPHRTAMFAAGYEGFDAPRFSVRLNEAPALRRSRAHHVDWVLTLEPARLRR